MSKPEKPEEEVLSEEDSSALKQHIHGGLSTSITFAEVVNIINNMLVNEVNERISSMSEEELLKSSDDLKDLIRKAEAEAEAEAEEKAD